MADKRTQNIDSEVLNNAPNMTFLKETLSMYLNTAYNLLTKVDSRRSIILEPVILGFLAI